MATLSFPFFADGEGASCFPFLANCLFFPSTFFYKLLLFSFFPLYFSFNPHELVHSIAYSLSFYPSAEGLIYIRFRVHTPSSLARTSLSSTPREFYPFRPQNFQNNRYHSWHSRLLAWSHWTCDSQYPTLVFLDYPLHNHHHTGIWSYLP